MTPLSVSVVQTTELPGGIDADPGGEPELARAVPLLAEHFRRSLFLWQHDFDPALIDMAGRSQIEFLRKQLTHDRIDRRLRATVDQQGAAPYRAPRKAT